MDCNTTHLLEEAVNPVLLGKVPCCFDEVQLVVLFEHNQLEKRGARGAHIAGRREWQASPPDSEDLRLSPRTPVACVGRGRRAALRTRWCV